MSFSVSSDYSKTTYHDQPRCHDRTGLASKRPDPMMGVERDAGDMCMSQVQIVSVEEQLHVR